MLMLSSVADCTLVLGCIPFSPKMGSVKENKCETVLLEITSTPWGRWIHMCVSSRLTSEVLPWHRITLLCRGEFWS